MKHKIIGVLYCTRRMRIVAHTVSYFNKKKRAERAMRRLERKYRWMFIDLYDAEFFQRRREGETPF